MHSLCATAFSLGPVGTGCVLPKICGSGWVGSVGYWTHEHLCISLYVIWIRMLKQKVDFLLW